jgi:hypothetical protein
MRRMALLLVLIAIIIGGYYLWSQTGRDFDAPSVDTQIKNAAEYGVDSGNGNLVGIQPYMFPYDYSDRERFLAKMDAYFKLIMDKGWLKNKTVVVLPEYLGTWLVVENEKSSVYETMNMNQAMQLMAVSNLGPFIRGAVISPANNRVEYSLFAMKSKSMTDAYNYVFSQLAKKYQVTIVAGSIVLADPSIQDGQLVSHNGPLYSVSPVFGMDGKIQALTYKSFPIATEQPFLKAASVEDLAVTQTPLGKLGVMVCADSWYPQSYEVMKVKGAEVVAVPSYTTGDEDMDKPWLGYSGYPNPADVDTSDINSITLRQAWDKYTLAGRLPRVGIQNGMIVCLRGQLWDLGSDGSSTVVKNGQRFNQPDVDGADLVNLWL